MSARVKGRHEGAHLFRCEARARRGGQPSPRLPQVDTKGDCPSAPPPAAAFCCFSFLTPLTPASQHPPRSYKPLGRRQTLVRGGQSVTALTGRPVSPVPPGSPPRPRPRPRPRPALGGRGVLLITPAAAVYRAVHLVFDTRL